MRSITSPQDLLGTLVDEQHLPMMRSKDHLSNKQLLLLCVVAASIFAVLAAWSLEKKSCTRLQPKPPIEHDTGHHRSASMNSTMDAFRKDLVAVAVKIDGQQEEGDDEPQPTVDIRPFYDLIEYALDTFGVRLVYTDVFWEIEWYFPEDWYRPRTEEKEYECNWHGIGCEWYDLWWIWHFVGAISAEKLLHQGSLLLDATTGERVNDTITFMNEIHLLKEQAYVTKMNFHAEHGFIWHFMAETMPELDSYPLQMAHDFCSMYDRPFYVPYANKFIGAECYHGIGHGIFEVLAVQQLGLETYTASKALRAKGGFALKDETFCQAYRICEGAPNVTTAPRKHCRGGIQHAYWLMSNTLPKEKTSVNRYFDELEKRCNDKAIL